ncbi:hypothetical protein JYU34_001493 [Plutella xylostella]|uniref:D-isomer specific 2-hydroxyacid dehydrogenase catalytic domain-containing protein n=1 Tax=Plutella xylostella TaxID=51655 RepID=A0ABQ7R456_PLUXY|nr:hypothetical protein JYU34_001493 [Plutella xylostella]
MSKDLKVLVSSNDFPESAIKILSDKFTVVVSRYSNYGESARTVNREELLRLIPGCAALVWCSDSPITKELLDAAGGEGL